MFNQTVRLSAKQVRLQHSGDKGNVGETGIGGGEKEEAVWEIRGTWRVEP